MSSATVLSTCEEAGMVPLCAENSQQQECFSPGESIEKVMDASLCAPANFSVNPDCFPLDYVFAYGDGGQAEVLKADNSTGEVVWRKTAVEGLSGQIGKNFYALCQDLIPTTTTTTTTTTMAPTTLSREGVKQHLTRTECPLIQQTENHDSDSETQDGLPEIDLFLNPGRKGELEELELWVEKNEENMTYTEVRHMYIWYPFVSHVMSSFPQDTFSRIYPNLFRLLWHSMPPCFPSNDHPDSPHMLSRCSWLGKDINCSEIFTPVITDSGVCCAFNLQDNLRDSEFSRLVQAMQEPQIQKGEEVRKVMSGMGRGLQVVLDQNSHRSKFSHIIEVLIFSGSATSPSSHDSLASSCSWANLRNSLFFNGAI